MFPVYLRRAADEPLPEEPCAYLVGANGAFVRKRTAVYEAVVPVSRVPSLGEVREEATYLLPPLPPHLVLQMILFFRAIYAREKSEAFLLISFHPRRGTFRLEAPPQVVTASSCKVTLPDRPAEGFIFVGDAHSHGSGSAFHSSTDEHDETTQDGIHITIGQVDKKRVDISSMLVVLGRRFKLPPERVLGGLEKHEAGSRQTTILEPVPEGVARGDGPNGHGRVGGLDQIILRYADQITGFVTRRRRRKPRARARTVYTYELAGYEVVVPPDTPEEEQKPPLEWGMQVERVEPSYTYHTVIERPGVGAHWGYDPDAWHPEAWHGTNIGFRPTPEAQRVENGGPTFVGDPSLRLHSAQDDGAGGTTGARDPYTTPLDTDTVVVVEGGVGQKKEEGP